MKFRILLVCFIIFLSVITISTYSQKDIRVMNYKEFDTYLHKNNDTTYIFNFWATWCKPCIEELPAFEKLHNKYKNEKMKVVLVSLDFPSHIKSQLIPYIDKNKIKPEVIVLDDPDSNYWINQINQAWTGAIPATLIYKSKKRDFYERSFSFFELDSIVKLKMEK